LNSQDFGGRDNAVSLLSAKEMAFFIISTHLHDTNYRRTTAGKNWDHLNAAGNNSRFSADFFGICYITKLMKNNL
jgi:hypothetical protein